jgi:HPt (histidine-containing phosphotransfer) domain-containing protein
MAQRFQHDEDLIRNLLSYFLEDILVQIKNLFDSMETGDLPAAELRAHTIKGAAANIGAQALRAVAEKLESCAKEGDLPAMQTHREELELQCERLREQLKQELEGISPGYSPAKERNT